VTTVTRRSLLAVMAARTIPSAGHISPRVLRLLWLEASGWKLRGVQTSWRQRMITADNHRDEALASVELNEEGFFVHPEQWTEAMVPALAA
jgi:hypothetical protein